MNTNKVVSARKRGFFSLPASLLGLTVLIASTAAAADTHGALISPTAAARRCFRYPVGLSLPDRQALTQSLLASAFFGSDALYFDLGDENTGTTELERPEPSRLESENPPSERPDFPQKPGLSESELYSYDYTKLKEGRLALFPYDMSGNPQPGEILLSNTTAIDFTGENSPQAIAARDYPIKARLDGDPLVLIVHTHGTEAFAPEGETSVDPSTSGRSNDITENIVSVGAVMADMLNRAGIPTLHCEIMHDLESYRNSYNYSSDTVQKYLAEYPSIKYVFDVHRDAIVRQNGDIVRPVCLVDGEASAQIMLLVGTNELGADHPDWQSHLTIAARLQLKLLENSPKLARPINIRGASFNQQSAPGSLLIEIGSSGNTLTEAKRAARELTYSLIELIRENSEQP